ncbi:MAG: lamin tail domain-containing protein [Patescibacteria group bacterium]
MAKTKTNNKFFSLFLICIFLVSFFAGWQENQKSKAEDLTSPILINEVAPSESRDWIEFYIQESGDYSGFKVKEGATSTPTLLTTFPDNFYLQTGDFIILHFKKESYETDETENNGENGIWDLYTADSGLQATDNVIILENNSGEIIEGMCYANQSGTWTGSQNAFDSLIDAGQWQGEKSQPESFCIDWTNNKTVSSLSNKSLGRDQDFTDTNSKDDWYLYDAQTPGQPNIIEIDEPEPSPTSTPKTYSDEIIINELYPNPPGPDENDEFIEMKNLGSEAIDLKDWQIRDKSTNYKIKTANFSSTQISPGEFFVIYRPTSGIALNNTGGETVLLLSPNNETKSSISYSGSAPGGQSFASFQSGWSWTTQPTPSEENILTSAAAPNQKPKAIAGENKKIYLNEEVTFDGSNSYDPDNDPLTYLWDFGDGSSATSAITTHKYTKEGKYTAKLTVEDEREGIDDDTLLVSVTKQKEEKKKTTKKKIDKKEIQKPKGPFSRDIIITEFLPNPTGSDYGDGTPKSGEWVEIKNKGKKEIDLNFWQLDDEEGGSRPYTIEDEKIKPGQYLVFYYPQTKINLNNSEDEVRLLDPDGKIVSKVEYSGAKEGISFAQDEKTNKWQWTQTPTPGKLNKITELKEEAKSTKTRSYPEIDSANKTSKTQEEELIKTISIQEAKEQERYTKVKVEGNVLVEPQVLGSKIFYIQDKTAGIQIYFSKEDFPKLTLGDLIMVSGKVSEAGGEKKINLSQKEDIAFLSHSEPPKTQALKTGEIDEIYEGKLVEIQGKVIKKIGLTFYLDDGSGQIRVYLSKTANIKKEGIKKDETVKIKGIVSQTKSGFRLLPRYENDVLVGEGEIAAADEIGGILSNKKLPSVGNDFWMIVLLALTLTVLIFLPKAVFSAKKV